MRPAKKQSKWSAEEDALIIELRGGGMKWEDISTRLPGRSAISCRLHYQNYLEKRISWDDERKTKLALVYERLKPQMWAKVAEELQVPWRAAEAMHWKLGESEIARRTGATPFSLTPGQIEAQSRATTQRTPMHSQSNSQDGLGRDPYYSPPAAYEQATPHMGMTSAVMARRESLPPPAPPNMGPSRPGSTRAMQTMSMSAPPTAAVTPPAMSQHGAPPPQPEVNYELGRGLPPMHSQPPPRIPGPLPSITELTTGLHLRNNVQASSRPDMMYSAVKWTEPVGPQSHSDQMPRTKRRASPGDMTRDDYQRRRRT